MEIHDASAFDGTGALFGFVGFDSITRENAGSTVIKQAAIEQLTRIFGAQASSPTDVKFVDWSQEKYTATQDDRKHRHLILIMDYRHQQKNCIN